MNGEQLYKNVNELESIEQTIKDLREELATLNENYNLENSTRVTEIEDEISSWEDDFDQEELDEIREIEKQVDNLRSATFIPEDKFTGYIMDWYMEQLPHINFNELPFSQINWQNVADESESYYNEVEYQGDKYYVIG